MIYISKGIVQKNSTEQLIFVVLGGQRFQLTRTDAMVWENGRFGFSVSHKPIEDQALIKLQKMGLVEIEPEDDAVSRYRIMARCICCPAVASKNDFIIRNDEKRVLFWLKHAGIRLTTAELTYLIEHQIKPQPELLYEENRQSLIETIYTKDTIGDNLLEHQMEFATCRDEIINVLLRLLKKKKILLL